MYSNGFWIPNEKSGLLQPETRIASSLKYSSTSVFAFSPKARTGKMSPGKRRSCM
jgi:hypothetical protein